MTEVAEVVATAAALLSVETARTIETTGTGDWSGVGRVRDNFGPFCSVALQVLYCIVFVLFDITIIDFCVLIFFFMLCVVSCVGIVFRCVCFRIRQYNINDLDALTEAETERYTRTQPTKMHLSPYNMTGLR